jgi:competence protein ComEC
MQQSRQRLNVVWPDGYTTCEAVVLSNPVEKPRTVAVDLLLANTHHKLKCYIHKDSRSRALGIGDGLRIKARLRQPDNWQRGTFDYSRFLQVHGFSGTAFVDSVGWQPATVSATGLPRLERTRLYFLKLRSRVLRRMADNGLTAQQYAVVAAMVLGDKSALTGELKSVYAETGVSHILALSGLHLGIVYMLLSLFFAGRRHLFTQVLTVLGIWAFVLLVGLPVSVTRSAVMLTVYALFSLGHRSRMSVNVLAFAAIVLLLVNPLSLYDVGFQLSFLSVLAIVLFMPLVRPLLFRLPTFHSLLSSSLISLLSSVLPLLAVSCAAQLGVAPLTAYYFGCFPTYFPLANLVAVPAATLVLWLAPAVIAIPQLSFCLSAVVGLLNSVLSLLATIPGASISGLHPTQLQVAALYVVIAAAYLLLSKWMGRK